MFPGPFQPPCMSLKATVAVAVGSTTICAGELSQRTQFATETPLVCVTISAAPLAGATFRLNVQLTTLTLDGPPGPFPTDRAAHISMLQAHIL